jgi:hypothetical protein
VASQPAERRPAGGARIGRPPDDATPRQAIEAIVRRVRTFTESERRRLGRWTSASLRDARVARDTERARRRAFEILGHDPERRRIWDNASKPLYDALAGSAGEERRWRWIMLATHLIALVAIINLPSGLPPLLVFLVSLAAPISAWLAGGRGTAWLGAIHAALADALVDQLDPEQVAILRQPWAGAVESDPPIRPPLVGTISTLAPSGLLVIAFIVVALTSLPG